MLLLIGRGKRQWVYMGESREMVRDGRNEPRWDGISCGCTRVIGGGWSDHGSVSGVAYGYR